MKKQREVIAPVNVYMPVAVKRELERQAKEQNRSLSGHIVYLLQRMIESVKLSRGAA